MSIWNTISLPLTKRVNPQLVASQLVSVQPMKMPKGLLNYIDDNFCELQSGQIEFIEYLRKTYGGPWPLIDEIVRSGKYHKSDIEELNKLRQEHREDYIKYKNDKLQQI